MTRSETLPDTEKVLSILSDSLVKLTPQAYIKAIQSCFGISSRAARKTLQQLVEEQQLCYQYHFGNTTVEFNFQRPVRVSDHFVLTPGPGLPADLGPDDIPIIIETGISFGSGQHPTTQLCLEAIDYWCCKPSKKQPKAILNAADIGTGSGVLSLALSKAANMNCDAFEIDPVSIHEARKNIAKNGMTDKIHLFETVMDPMGKEYDVICANLRLPTLRQLSEMIATCLSRTGAAILSGFREEEIPALLSSFGIQRMKPVWQKTRKNWSAFVLVPETC